VSHYRCGAQMLINTPLAKRQARQGVGCNNKMGSCFAVETNKPRRDHCASAGGPAADEVLVAAAKDGDEQAFGVLIERHHQRMLALALRYVRVREDVEDIVQQTFQKAFVYLHRFEGRSAFSTWLTRIAINEALMLLRRGCGLREVSIDESSNGEQTSGDLELSDSSPDPEASCLRREAAGILSAAMHKLTPPVRTVIELRRRAVSRVDSPSSSEWVFRSAPSRHGSSMAEESCARQWRVLRSLQKRSSAISYCPLRMIGKSPPVQTILLRAVQEKTSNSQPTGLCVSGESLTPTTAVDRHFYPMSAASTAHRVTGGTAITTVFRSQLGFCCRILFGSPAEMFAGDCPHSGSTSWSRFILRTLDSTTCQTHTLARPLH